MPAQRSRSDVPFDSRSAFPGFAGVPGWGAVVIAVAATLAGFAIEAGSGHHDLGGIFSWFFALGCVAAVLAVRHSGLFTAVIQPPLLLFVAIPLAYYLMHSGGFSGLKDGLITCGYPLIERFPLMLFTTAVVLLIGLVRWYLAMSQPAAEESAQPGAKSTGPSGLVARLLNNINAGKAGRSAKPRHGDRPSGAKRPARERAAERDRGFRERPAPSRARHARPSREDAFADARPRHRRDPARGYDEPMDPPRRPRREAPRYDDGRTSPPRRPRPDAYPPREYRDPREYREDRQPRTGRYEPSPPREQYPPRSARPPYPPQGPYPPRRRPEPDHHPVSRVRYRGDSDPGLDADRPDPRERRR